MWEIASRGSGSYLVAELGQPWGDAASCTSCGKCVAVCPTGALFHKGRAVGETRHDVAMIDFLETARESGEWMERSDGAAPASAGEPGGDGRTEARP